MASVNYIAEMKSHPCATANQYWWFNPSDRKDADHSVFYVDQRTEPHRWVFAGSLGSEFELPFFALRLSMPQIKLANTPKTFIEQDGLVFIYSYGVEVAPGLPEKIETIYVHSPKLTVCLDSLTNKATGTFEGVIRDPGLPLKGEFVLSFDESF